MEYSALTRGIITVEFTLPDEQLVSDTLTYLSEGLNSSMDYFQVGSFPGIHAVITPNRNEFDRCVRDILHLDIEIPSNLGRVALPQKTDLVVLSPRAWKEESIYDPGCYRGVLHHETVHILEEYLSPNIEEVPRWWSEGLAIYLSGQWVTLSREEPELVECIERGEIPSFTGMLQDVGLSYLWGWTCVMYIELIYGQKMINTLVRECSRNFLAKLGETDSSFEEKWNRWLPLLKSALK